MAEEVSSLCEECSLINNIKLSGPSRKEYENETAYAEAVWTAWYYGPTVGHIHANKTACALCRVLCEVVPYSERDDPSIQIALRFVDQFGYCSGCGTSAPDSGEVQGNVYGLQLALGPFHSSAAPIPWRDGLRVFAYRDSREEVKRKVPRLATTDSVCGETLKKANHWLESCIAGHWRCCETIAGLHVDDQKHSTVLPTRVVLVSSEECPKLIETKGGKGSYAALSYRWGNSKHLRTTKSNIEAFKTGLPIDCLPATIRDAIEVVRQLDVRYLWVDSLCIIQDNDDDWDAEAASMPMVYQHAVVTIAVLGDRDSDSGFYKRKPVEPQVSIPWVQCEDDGEIRPLGTIGITSVLPLIRTLQRPLTGGYETVTALAQELSSSSWSRRAWTLQERMLSRRTLYFGDYQMYWECQNGSMSEDGFDELVGGLVEKRIWIQRIAAQEGASYFTEMWRASVFDQREKLENYHVFSVAQKLTKAAGGLASSNTARSLRTFVQRATGFEIAPRMSLDQDGLVKDYTSRQLSVLNDKLTAFSGLAAVVARRTKQEYHAGLWTSQLAKSFFWHPEVPRASVSRPERAPSWSWASRDGKIRAWDNVVNSAGGDAYGLRSGALEGDLRNTAFLDHNPIMIRQRGVKPLSLRTDAFVAKAFRSSLGCDFYSGIVGQLNTTLGLWPMYYDTHGTWVEYGHLLFVDASIPWLAATEPVPVSRLCPVCQENCNSKGEATAIAHMQYCPNEPLRSETASSCAKFVGVALFDNSRDPPQTFQTILLWHESDTTTFWQKAKPHNHFLPSKVWCLGEEPKMRPLYSSDNEYSGGANVLGMERHDEPLSIGPKEMRRHFTRRRRRYFLLLVEQTAVPDTYRRIGIGMAYWLPGLNHLGGVPLHKFSPWKTVVLI